MLDLVGGNNLGMALRLPCSGRADDARLKQLGLSRVDCPKFEKKTAEEIEEEKASLQRAMDRMTKTIPWASEMKKKHGRGFAGEDACPICSKRIRFTIADYNGHMHARCETADCVNFME